MKTGLNMTFLQTDGNNFQFNPNQMRIGLGVCYQRILLTLETRMFSLSVVQALAKQYCVLSFFECGHLMTFLKEQNTETHFGVAFLLKFRRFNSETHLNLRVLLARSETVEHLNDEVWEYITRNPTEVLLIFDGIDEVAAKSKIAADDESDYKSTAEARMPLDCLYNKVASGKLLPGVTVVTTTRPTAVSCLNQLIFHRILEILGFTAEQVEDYVHGEVHRGYSRPQ